MTMLSCALPITLDIHGRTIQYKTIILKIDSLQPVINFQKQTILTSLIYSTIHTIFNLLFFIVSSFIPDNVSTLRRNKCIQLYTRGYIILKMNDTKHTYEVHNKLSGVFTATSLKIKCNVFLLVEVNFSPSVFNINKSI